MSTSLGRGRGARVKLDSKVGRPPTATSKSISGMTTPPIKTPTTPTIEGVFPFSQGSEPTLPVTVIKALKAGCVTIDQLLQLSSFLVQNGNKLENSHAEIIVELFVALRSFVHSPQIPAPRIRSMRYAVLRLLEIRQQGWTMAPASENYYKQHIAQMETSEAVSSGTSSAVTNHDSGSYSSSTANHEIIKPMPQEEAWESLDTETVTRNDQFEDSAFKEANNATGTPAVQQFNCIPQSLATGRDGAIANTANPPNGEGTLLTASSVVTNQEPYRPVSETDVGRTDGVVDASQPPPTISSSNLHSRYLTNSKGQTLIISACSPLIVGMAENILLRQIPTLQSMPTSLEMVTKQKKSTRDSAVQCDIPFEKSIAPTVNSTGPVDLFVRHLHETVDDKVLFAAFELFGDILNARVQTDDDGFSKGYGFVSFGSHEAATRAASAMNGFELRQKKLYVALAQRKDDIKGGERDYDDQHNKPVYSHFSKPAYQRSKSETPSGGGRAMKQIDDLLFDETDICGMEEFGAGGDAEMSRAPPREREAPPQRDSGVKWHVTGKSRSFPTPKSDSTTRDSMDRPHSSLRVSVDPRGRYDDEAESEEASPRSASPDSPREPVVIGPWLKMGVLFASRRDPDGNLDNLVDDPQPMEKLLQDIPSTSITSEYRQFLLALSLSPLSQEPPLENWEVYCRQQNDCCVECMTEAFHPLRYLDYWERTSPQERYNRRPAYEEHDHNRRPTYEEHDHNRRPTYEEHDHRKVDYSKIYGPPNFNNPPPRSNADKQRNESTSSQPSISPNSDILPSSHLLKKSMSGNETTQEASDLTLVTTLGSQDEFIMRSASSPRGQVSVPPGFESQSTILYEDQLSALMMSTDFDEVPVEESKDERQKIRGFSTPEDSLLVNVSTLAEEMKKFDDYGL